jgi:hypothetical protein
MRVAIDWFSFTIPATSISDDVAGFEYPLIWTSDIRSAFEPNGNRVLNDLSDSIPGRGRPPYNHSYKLDGLTVFCHPKFDHILFEVTGTGCEMLRQAGELEWIIRQFADRTTRLDLAIDAETDASPVHAHNIAVAGRHKSHSLIESTTGITAYIGSRTSERYLRVYRYNPPHPRSNLLRFEFVYRKRYAKEIARRLAVSNFALAGLARQSLCDYELWSVAAFVGTDEEFDTSYSNPQKTDASTLLWLTGTVAPAFRKLVCNGSIDDPIEFVKVYFLS